MKRKMCLEVSFACFLGLLWAAAAAAQDSVSGRFGWEGVDVSYWSMRSEDGQGLATVTAEDGTVLAEAVVGRDSATINVAGVQITGEVEITDEEEKVVNAFLQTKEAAAIRALATALADDIPPKDRGKISGLLAIAWVLGEGPGARAILGDCFGCCGPGCWGCWLLGSCYTTACAIHDGCVALFGHTNKKCLALLAVAVASYVAQCL